jgi:hypothetical protein
MKHLLWMGILAAALAPLARTVEAQDADAVRAAGTPACRLSKPCSTWGLSDLRGTYAFTASAWQDLSEINPALPKGYAPVTIVGSYKVDRNGDLTGWAVVNAGGVPMKAEFVDSRIDAPQADCSFALSLSMRISDFGGAISGPYSYVGVIAGSASALELDYMMLGTGPGSHVELDHAKRISMNVR